MTNPLIEQLVTELKPQAVLRNRQLWWMALYVLILAVILVRTGLGFRSDLASSLWWKPGMFFCAGLASLFLLADIARPGHRIQLWHFVPLLFADALFGWQLITQLLHQTFAQIASLHDVGAFCCISVITGGGALILCGLWWGWLQKTASDHPTLLGALSGFCAGCLAATAYALHCDRDAVFYIGVYYFVPIGVLTAMGGWLGGKYLDW